MGIFPNDASIVRLVGAMMLEQNDEWSLNRRYMQPLRGLQTVSDTVPHSAVGGSPLSTVHLKALSGLWT